ncbi:MAG: feruloyl-CoA synthase [Rhodobacteraceae bacterium]|nr:feruloyl-CoA synthase [Paracoccaceae bacterium]
MARDTTTPDIVTETRPDGTILVRQTAPLPAWPRCMNDRLAHWAAVAPDRVWLAERHGDGWARLTYAQGLAAVERIGAGLLAAGLSVDRPLLILSGNSIAHALMALGAQHVGIPSAAIAPAYALAGPDSAKLAQVRDQLTPGMVFAEDANPFLPAIAAAFAPDVILCSRTGTLPDRPCIPFDRFTSGTTGSPKAVIQTQGMLCSNQAMVLAAYDFMAIEPPVILDWAPWNHTASGNKVFNMALHNGGTYHIDDGRPAAAHIDRTIANLRDVAPTWYFNVPVGYQFLLDRLEGDQALQTHFFSRLRMLMYAGAGMSQPVWDRLSALAARQGKPDLPIVSGLGATETGPFALYYTDRKDRPGNIGIPAPGVVLKLVPQGDKLEARLKSPSVTPGYWRNPTLTAAAFDDEGFYRLGDALRFAVPGDAAAGFLFDGRLAENFKLATGTWVAVGALRADLVNALGGLASDAVIAGEERDDLRALLVPNLTRLREVAGLPDADTATLAAHPAVQAALADHLTAHARAATGSASRVVAAMILTTPLSFDLGEVTDKGSVNQRAVLRHRGDLVEALYAGGPGVIRADRTGAR